MKTENTREVLILTRHQFWELIDSKVGRVPMKLGNVTFSRDQLTRKLCYDIPSSQWDSDAIANDLIA